jgi:hypothetical protein
MDSVEAHHATAVIDGDYGMFWCDLEFCHPDKSKGTAYWLFNGKCHLIRISECVQDMVGVAGAKNIPLFVKRIYDHEKGHALFTTWKLRELHEYIKDKSVPHNLWNILEDCRIEYRMSTEHKIKWGWERWLLMHDDLDEDGLPHPAAVLLNLKMIERRAVRLDDYLDKFTGDARVRVDEVHEFYKKVTTRCKKTKRRDASLYVVDTAKDMCDKWPFLKSGGFPEGLLEDMEEMIGETIRGGGGGMSAADERDWKDDKLIDPKTTSKEILEDGDSDVKKVEDPLMLEKFPCNGWSPGCGDHLVDILKDCLSSGEEAVLATTDPKEDMETEEFMSKTPDFYREKEDADTDKKRGKICIIYDCSGSMNGFHHEEGIKMMDAFFTIHKQGEVDVVAWFTGDGSQLRVGGNTSNNILEYINANGGCESYGMAMDEAEEDMLAAVDDGGCVICWTDAGITDDYKPRTSDFKMKGIEPIGCYVGEVDNMDNILKYFPRLRS